MRKEIKAKEALEDIKSGMSDGALMDKYKITATGLASLYRRMVQAGLLPHSDLDQRRSPYAPDTVRNLSDPE
jgi:hypothetical protein